jgi:membrane-associated phospholipid phosphatase
MRGELLRQAPDNYTTAPPLLSGKARPVAATIAGACLAVTAFLAVWVTHETSLDWPDAVIDAKARAAFGGDPHLLTLLVWPAGEVPVFAIALAMALACLAWQRYRKTALVVISVPAATTITEWLLKPLVGRLKWGSLSFPSGHTTGAFTLAAVLVVLLIGRPGVGMPRTLRAAVAVTALLAAAFVAFALIAEGVHYFTDTVAGAAIGIGTVLTTALMIDLLWPAAQRFLRSWA